MNQCTSLAKVHLRVSAQIGKRKKENSKNFTWQKYLAQGIESLHTTLTKGGCGRSHFGKSWKIYLALKNKYFNLPARLILSLPKFFVRKFCRETNYFNYEIKTCNKMMNWRISHDNKSQGYKVNDNILPGLWEGFHSLLGLFELFSLLQRNNKYED